MKRIILALSCGVALTLLVVANPVRGQGGPPPPPNGGTPPAKPGLPCPPTGCPTNTPTITPTPTVTPTPSPTATATPIPLFVKLALGHKSLAVGKQQKITVTTVSGVSVKVVVQFPNKNKKTFQGVADATGTFLRTFKQPANKTTATSKTVSVTATVTRGTEPAKKANKKYSIK